MPTKKSRANQALGKAIRAARVRRGESQEGFSRRAEVPIDLSYFGAVERGESTSRSTGPSLPLTG